MKKILIILLFVPFMLNAQTPAPLVDLSEYHDDNRIKEMTDLNFTNITEGGYQIPSITADAITVTTATITTATVTNADIDSATIVHLDYDPPHGAMSFADSAFVVALSQNVWGKITNVANDLFTVQDADDITIAGDSMTIAVDGDYILNWSLSFSGGPSDVFQIVVYKNAVLESVKMSRKTSNADTGNMGLPVYIENLVVGDDLSFYIRNTGDNDDATLVASSIYIYMLHPD